MENSTIKKTVLVVDDEPSVRSTVTRSLTREYRVIEASNGEIAVDIARRQKPDMILMDIMMPTMDGYTACHIIKKDPATKSIPVVLLTALGFELNKKLGDQIGANGYVTKPFDYHLLLDTIEQLLRDMPGAEEK